VSEEAARSLASLFLTDAARFDDAARGLAGSGRTFDIPITGQSMGRALPDGTLVRVTLEDGSTAAVGDVVIFRDRSRLAAHRVICRSAPRRRLVTRGDARMSPDDPVAFANILGRVAGIVAADRELHPVPGDERRGIPTMLDRPVVLIMSIALAIAPSLARSTSRVLTLLERAWKSRV
jgi:hypothetical protein